MPSLLGATIGPYRILEQVGMGGMATIYKAYHAAMDRQVAVKVLPHHFARDPRFVQRFYQEARLIARLEHRNILPVYDFGEVEGTTYLVMRYLQAGTVKDILSRGPLPFADAARLLADVAAALDYAHAMGVIHRDVKPSNVLVDPQGNAYLTDFGLAKVLQASSELTGSAAVGTPAYMSPEQTLGKSLTAQSDVYSLGVMVYEMVTGKPPFNADTPMAIALMHVHEPLPLPRSLRSDLPEAAELAVLKALAKAPEERYQTAGALARAFSDALGHTEGRADNEFTLEQRLAELAGAVTAVRSQKAAVPGAMEAGQPVQPARRRPWWPVAGFFLGVVVAPMGCSLLRPRDSADPTGGPLSILVISACLAALLLAAFSVWAFLARPSTSASTDSRRFHNRTALAAVGCGWLALLFGPLPLLIAPVRYLAGPWFLLPAAATPLSVLLAGWAWRSEQRSATTQGELEAMLGFGLGGATAVLIVLGLFIYDALN